MGLFFASLKMRPLKGFFRTEVVFEDKNFQFLSSKQLRSERFSLGTPFFRRKKQCVVRQKFVVRPKILRGAIRHKKRCFLWIRCGNSLPIIRVYTIEIGVTFVLTIHKTLIFKYLS